MCPTLRASVRPDHAATGPDRVVSPARRPRIPPVSTVPLKLFYRHAENAVMTGFPDLALVWTVRREVDSSGTRPDPAVTGWLAARSPNKTGLCSRSGLRAQQVQVPCERRQQGHFTDFRFGRTDAVEKSNARVRHLRAGQWVGNRFEAAEVVPQKLAERTIRAQSIRSRRLDTNLLRANFSRPKCCGNFSHPNASGAKLRPPMVKKPRIRFEARGRATTLRREPHAFACASGWCVAAAARR